MASSREHLNPEPVGAQTIGREQFDAAAGAAQASPVAVAARYSRTHHKLEVSFANGVDIAVPIALIQDLQMLAHAPTPAQLADVEIWGGGQSIYFPRLDESVWAPGLLSGIYGTKLWMRDLARQMGSVKSPAKAAAARENGRKGGRPRKAVASVASVGAVTSSKPVAGAQALPSEPVSRAAVGPGVAAGGKVVVRKRP
ncbi:DUF2442 domain-containing protein [Paraburkholderia tropica]|uniref:DUF2442 domain-containing protein n=1 Tax=Paraburkholderia tropica TaxID=92647 RepID=UPI002AB77B8D|nr:DUF2442 domain-containing protein [Paraburkholderia tropica]